jgi:kinesin family member C2/C3
MIGDAGDSGLVLRIYKTIFAHAEQEWNDIGVQTEVSMSMLEVYNEQIFDLLDTSVKIYDPKNPNPSNSLEVRHARSGSVYVDKLTEYGVKNTTEVSTLLNLGGNKRQDGREENPSEHNAKSHLLVCIKIQRTNPQSKQVTSGTIYLGDLAGSDHTDLLAATGQRLREAQYVNKSLSALSDVISGLSNHQKNVPYRASTLTHILQDCLKPNSSRILMIINVHPLPMFKSESCHSLDFGVKCRAVQLGPVKRHIAYTS